MLVDSSGSRKPSAAADSTTKQAYARHPAVLAELPAVMDGGARAYGFANDEWTNARIAVMFEIEFGMRLTSIQAFHLLSGLVPGPGLTSPAPGIGQECLVYRQVVDR